MLKTKQGGCLPKLPHHYPEVEQDDILFHNIVQAPLQREKGLSEVSSGLDEYLHWSISSICTPSVSKRFPSSTSLHLLHVVERSKERK